MDKLVGLLGSHRVGKSTLGHNMTKYGWRFKQISISKMQAQYGWDSANQDYPWEERKDIQHTLLNQFSLRLHHMASNVRTDVLRDIDVTVTDRTPLDLVGYALWSFPKEPTAQDEAWMEWYTNECIKLTNRFYDKIVVVQPGIPLVECETSADADPDMMETFNQYYLGLMLRNDLRIERKIMPRELTDLGLRESFLLGWDTENV